MDAEHAVPLRSSAMPEDFKWRVIDWHYQFYMGPKATENMAMSGQLNTTDMSPSCILGTFREDPQYPNSSRHLSVLLALQCFVSCTRVPSNSWYIMVYIIIICTSNLQLFKLYRLNTSQLHKARNAIMSNQRHCKSIQDALIPLDILLWNFCCLAKPDRSDHVSLEKCQDSFVPRGPQDGAYDASRPAIFWVLQRSRVQIVKLGARTKHFAWTTYLPQVSWISFYCFWLSVIAWTTLTCILSSHLNDAQGCTCSAKVSPLRKTSNPFCPVTPNKTGWREYIEHKDPEVLCFPCAASFMISWYLVWIPVLNASVLTLHTSSGTTYFRTWG